jgi:hypothetical protein
MLTKANRVDLALLMMLILPGCKSRRANTNLLKLDVANHVLANAYEETPCLWSVDLKYGTKFAK